MTKKWHASAQSAIREAGPKPILNICKIGMVTRDYRVKFPNGYRDFSHALPQVLKSLDKNGCDAALFSLYSIIPRGGYDPCIAFDGLSNIKAIFLEEFQDGKNRKGGRNVTYYRTTSGWKEYAYCQVFGTLAGMSQPAIDDFVKNETPKRILGNCCVLLCGETNGVKYSPADKKVHDTFGLRKSVPQEVNVILNPIHDRMTRFEMKLKRQFLSQKKRWVISIWNKGKQDKNGKVKDGNGPAWTVFHDGTEVDVSRIQNDLGVEIGISECK
jgi:hypothetical protein